MIRILLSLMVLWSASAAADKVCEANASRVLDRFFRTVEVDVEIVQANYIRDLQILSLQNTTPGQQNQEYVGLFQVSYRPGDFSLYKQQTLRVTFRSSVGCDQLKVLSLDVMKNVLTEYGDAARQGRSNSLSCEPR